MLKPCAKPFAQFADLAEPFAGIDGIADAIDPLIRGSEVGVAGQHGKIEES